MKFGNLQAMHFIWLMAAIVFFFIWSYKKRKRDMELFAHKDLLNDLTGSLDRKRQKLKGYFVMGSLILIIFSLMRPQWGFEWKEVTRSGLDILIALDTSNSMLAEDVKPNRLERSKFAIRDLMKKLQGDRIGLIAFAGNAFLQCPLTVDYSGFALSLDDLDVNTIPKGGTSLSDAVRVAIDSYEGGKKQYKVLVVITDGEDHEGSLMEWAEKAKEKGIKIFAIGIGTKEGELIPIRGESGGITFLKDRKGNVVKTRLDEASLQNLSLTTGGSYVKATNKEFGLDLIYEEKLSQMEKREIKNTMVKRYEERFQISIILALILLCIEPFIIERKKMVRGQGSGVRGEKTKILLILLCCLSIISINTVVFAQTEATDNNLKEALSAEQSAEQTIDSDLEKYEKAVEKDPDSDIANYNLGTAYYRKGEYEKSLESFMKSLNTEDRDIEARAIYNMANSKYKMGSMQADKDLNGAIEHYKESLEYYKRAMELDESDRDAKYNHELIEQKIKILMDKMKNQQQQQDQDQNQDGDENKDKENQEGQNKEGQQEQSEDEKQQSSDKEQSGEEKEKGENGESGADQEQGEQEMESAGKEDEASEQMSPDEARMLLEAYGQDEAREEVNQKLRGRHGEVLKNW
jgi:Ca-activated chloride channel family protein